MLTVYFNSLTNPKFLDEFLNPLFQKYRPNIFYTKNYLSFLRLSEKYNINFFIAKENKCFAFFPYMIKENIMYGLRYGGIWVKYCNKGFAKKFTKKFLKFCKSQNILKIQIRNYPFMETIKIGRIIKSEPFVYIDLTKDAAKLKTDISAAHRKSIGKAIKCNLRVCETEEYKYLALFYKFYKGLLKLKRVVPAKLDYFRNLFIFLRNNVRLVYVKDSEKVIAVSILLESLPNVFMMYGGMDQDGYKKCAKHLMIYELIKRYKKRGYSRLILGTGAGTDKDNIYLFKKGFTGKESHIYTYEHACE